MPKLSEQASIAISVFYRAARDRTYTGQYSLPNPLSSNVIEKHIESVYNNVNKDDLYTIVAAIDSHYVNEKIEAFNKKAKENR